MIIVACSQACSTKVGDPTLKKCNDRQTNVDTDNAAN